MRRSGLIKKAAQATFDHTGRLVETKPKIINASTLGPDRFSQETANGYFRLKFLEKQYFKWMTVGRDMRTNIYAIFGGICCFCVVFFPANWYDERHIKIEMKGRIAKEALDRKNYEEFLYESGKKSRLDYDIFQNLHSI